jgi:hypothetical protein
MLIAKSMDFTKGELLNELKRKINGAKKRGRKWVTIPLEDFLLAMEQDDQGGIEQLTGVMEEICGACCCHAIIENEGHWQQIAFVI